MQIIKGNMMPGQEDYSIILRSSVFIQKYFHLSSLDINIWISLFFDILEMGGQTF